MTSKQSKAVANLVETRGSVSQAMIKAGYSPKTAKNPMNLTKSKGWQEAMAVAGLTPDRLLRVMNDGLKANKTVTSLSGDIISTEADHAVRHKYLDTALKVAGAYSNTEGGSVHFHQHITGNREKYQL